MAGKFALIVGNSHYDDASLSRLKAPDADVRSLERVLQAPDVGQFDEVTTLVDEGCASVRKAIARFFEQRQSDDLLLLYFSGHGVKDEQGHLYLAVRDTETSLLAGTAIETAFIAARMDRSHSKRQVLMLDCCHSGAFAHGAKAAHGVSVGTAEAFEGRGVGRVVMTATDSTQYAWEGDQILGDAQNSLFTHFVIDGLKTGAADRDGDGVITVDELYDYVRDKVIDATPRQTPNKWTYRQQGDIVLAQNPLKKQSALPPEIEEGIGSTLTSLRLEAVRNLESLLRGHNAERTRAALDALRNLSTDDSRRVAKAAAEALRAYDEWLAAEGRAGAPQAAVSAAGALPADNAALEAEIHRAVEAEAARRGAAASAGARADSLGSDIFISYAREDRATASTLARMLTARGWRVWWDRNIRPGEAFDVMIERELCTCKCAVVLWSANSVNATWVRNEARRAARRGVLVPILIDSVETPLEFENLQAADLTSWQPPADHPELEALFERIGALSPIPAERLEREAADRRARDAADEARRKAEADAAEAARVEKERAEAARRAEAERVERERVEAARREAEAAAARKAEAARVEKERAEAARRADAERVEKERAEAARQAEAERVEKERAEAARRAEATLEAEIEQPSATTWFASRPFQVAAVVALVLGAIVATRWAGLWPPRGLPREVRNERRQQSAPSRTPAVTPAAQTAPPQSPQPQSSPPQAGGSASPAPTNPTDIPSAGTGETAGRGTIDTSSGRQTFPGARGADAGARARGGTIPGDDTAVRSQHRLRDLQTAAERAKQDALDVDADVRAEATFGQAVREERRATGLGRSGRNEAAAQAFQVATERFKKAATEARLNAEDEEQDRLKKQANEPARGQTPGASAPQKPAPLNLEVEKEAVIQTLRRYERASSGADVAAVRSVYPGVPGESLKQMTDARAFALTIRFTGEIRFYTFSEARSSAVAPTTFVFDVMTRSGQRNHEERAQTVTLEKQRGAWVIVDVR